MHSTGLRLLAPFETIVALLFALLVPLDGAGAVSASAASPAAFRISPTSLDFGNIPVGTISRSS
ncbi:hypothetical protein BH09ACT6_BH09ACT6_12090 [soil metagenome]